MSKVTKIICDKCERELDIDEWYYTGNIVSTAAKIDMGRQVMQGDYCKKCFKGMLEREFMILDK